MITALIQRITLFRLRGQGAQCTPKAVGVQLGVHLSLTLSKCFDSRYFRHRFDSDLGHHQLFKYCRALELGVPRSVVERPASTQGAVQPEPVDRGRREWGTRQSDLQRESQRPKRLFMLRCFGDAQDRTLTVMRPADRLELTSASDPEQLVATDSFRERCLPILKLSRQMRGQQMVAWLQRPVRRRRTTSCLSSVSELLRSRKAGVQRLV